MTAKINNPYPITRYDARHDVLHLFLSEQYDSSAEEEMPGIYVQKKDDTEDIVGFTILDFKENRHKVEKMYPQYLKYLPQQV